MSSHVDRMKQEQEELADRSLKLDTFMRDNPLFDNLDSVDQLLMQQQLREMTAYLLTLSKRIKRAS